MADSEFVESLSSLNLREDLESSDKTWKLQEQQAAPMPQFYLQQPQQQITPISNKSIPHINQQMSPMVQDQELLSQIKNAINSANIANDNLNTIFNMPGISNVPQNVMQRISGAGAPQNYMSFQPNMMGQRHKMNPNMPNMLIAEQNANMMEKYKQRNNNIQEINLRQAQAAQQAAQAAHVQAQAAQVAQVTPMQQEVQTQPTQTSTTTDVTNKLPLSQDVPSSSSLDINFEDVMKYSELAPFEMEPNMDQMMNSDFDFSDFLNFQDDTLGSSGNAGPSTSATNGN